MVPFFHVLFIYLFIYLFIDETLNWVYFIFSGHLATDA